MTNKYLESMIFGMLLGDGWISERLNCGFSGDLDSLQVIKDDLINLYGGIGKANISSKETLSEKYNIYLSHDLMRLLFLNYERPRCLWL